MRIGIDARFYGAVSQGLGRYCEQLVQGIARYGNDHTYVIFVLPGFRFTGLPDNMKVVECRYRWYGFAEQVLWPVFLYRHSLDLMHFTSFNVPILYRRKCIVTIHDLILMHQASAHASTRNPLLFHMKRWMYRIIIRSAITRAKHIIAVSRYTADDIEQTFKRTHGISVVHLGCSLPDYGTNHVPSLETLPKPYLLYVGNAYPHKNLDFLIRCFKRWRATHPEYSLVLIGEQDCFYRALSSRYPAKDGIIYSGKVSDGALREWYMSAHAFVFPSTYEGFGLPPLEAMTYGIPVAASHASCMPEILGEASQYFDPRDEDSCIKALDAVATDSTVRIRCSERGRVQAARYSWDTTAQATVQLYDTCKM